MMHPPQVRSEKEQCILGVGLSVYYINLMQRADSLEKTLVLGKIEGRRRRERMKWLDNITKSMDMNLSKLWKIVEDRGAWHTAVHGVAKSDVT